MHHGEEVRAIHRAYLQAGADLVITNSFGGTRFRLALHNMQDRVVELNAAAARIARIEADAEAERAGRPVLVAGSMGPTGELLEPMGNMSAPRARPRSPSRPRVWLPEVRTCCGSRR